LRPRLPVLAESARQPPVPGRRALQICLGLLWLLDAGLQFQPYMFGPFFVTQGIKLSAAGSPGVVASSVGWVSQLMLQHIALYNALFATTQLLIGCGMLFRRTLRLALAGSIAWALAIWWFGESLGGIFTGASPLAGFPGAVVLYALIAVLLWPAGQKPDGQVTARKPAFPASPATSGPLGGRWANALWLVLWGSFAYFLLLPDNRAPDAIAQIFSTTDGQPAWIVSLMNGMSSLAGERGTEISVVLAVACGLVALGVLVRPAIKPALVVSILLGLFFWFAEGAGGILTGQGTDPNTGPLLILLAACYWPWRGASVGVPAVPDDGRSIRLPYGN
jgi:hypothetical protein